MAKKFTLEKHLYESVLALGVNNRDLEIAILYSVKKRFYSDYKQELTEKQKLIATLIDGKQKKEVEDTFVKPTLLEIQDYIMERKSSVDPSTFFTYYESKDWVVGKSKMKDWKSAVANWERRTVSVNNYKYSTDELDAVQLDMNELSNYYQRLFPEFSQISFTQNIVNEFKCRILDGFSMEHFKQSMVNVRNNDWAREKNYSYCTLEYFSREKTLNTFAGFLAKSIRTVNQIIQYD